MYLNMYLNLGFAIVRPVSARYVMGTQQLLLIKLGVIVVGIAVAVGIRIFWSSAEAANIDAASVELVQIVNKAQEYYARPRILGGGGKAFTGFSIPAAFDTPENAYYTITTTAVQTMTILGTCRTAKNVTIEAVIYPTSHTMVINGPEDESPGSGTVHR